MKRFVFCPAWAFALLLASFSLASAVVVEHTFNVEEISLQRLCRPQVITAVNRRVPGPTINVREGDTVVVHVVNKSPYNLTLHWHGILQLGTQWSDGPEYVTQCPIPSGGNYTYQFHITEQEETTPETYKLNVKRGKTYLLRIINAALNEQHFFKIANHSFTVVAVDAAYTKQYHTDVLVLAPGHTVDVLFTANQKIGSYYMAFTPYRSSDVGINNSTTRGVVVYEGASSLAKPVDPNLPDPFDTPTAHKFYTNITGLVGGPHWVPVPRKVDEHMFITFGIGLDHCNEVAGCALPNSKLSASMNNESFVLPRGRGFSMLEAFYGNISGVYTRNFPNRPPFEFNYTEPLSILNGDPIAFAPKSTKVKTVKFNSTIQIVLQNTAILAAENHPIHIHGFNFHVLAQGFGNYNATRDEPKFNLVNPQIRNTIAVPVAGWAVIRFQANNPGIWLMHCHLETHLPWGLGMAFEVENGPTPSTRVPPPPAYLPKC
ncbi:Multicopper oxidase, copper-binding site [Sesbania bispinosa]|nr:Multicopper oxidase, copper-binding site [Sesbania bispinosa]